MSSSTQSSKMAASQASCHDPLDSLIDFTEYDKLSYQSPSVSPSTMKSEFTGGRSVPNAMPASQPDLSGPSHNYGMYRQQTGIPQGAVASTLAVNQGVSQYGYGSGYMSGLDSVDEFVDFGTAPRNGSFNASDIDMEFDSPNPEPAFFYPESSSSEFVNPSAIGASLSVPAVLPTQTSNVGRLWPGMHQQQAALAKAQAQQKQQQQIIQQQRQQSVTAQKPQRARGSHPPTDPIVEEKISQLLNSMRQNSVGSEDMDHMSSASQLAHANRMRKDEEEMDEDERLLASEEGKKLSSKERRQLRNKVSARAFRSRRKGKHHFILAQKQLLTFHDRIHLSTRRRNRSKSKREPRSPFRQPRPTRREHPSFRPHQNASLFSIILRLPGHSRRQSSHDCSTHSSPTTIRATSTTN